MKLNSLIFFLLMSALLSCNSSSKNETPNEKERSEVNRLIKKEFTKSIKLDSVKEQGLPKFKYHPNVYKLGIFDKTEGVCSVCSEKRNLKYNNSFYTKSDPYYICPWCISNGKASEYYKGTFQDYYGIEGLSPSPYEPDVEISKEAIYELTNKTPSYESWQQEVWLTHCNEPCAFIGYANSQNIKPFLDELKDDLEYIDDLYGIQGFAINNLSKDGAYQGCLFKCLKCNKHRLHSDPKW